VEIFHPEAQEDVTSKIVEGFFDVARDRRLGKPKGVKSEPPPEEPAAAPSGPVEAAPARSTEWGDLVADEGFRRVLEIIEKRRNINETVVVEVLGSARRVRAFSRHFDGLRRVMPFDIEVTVVSGMKAYTRKD
jgi:hypothetical protein